jgi:chromosome segregation ATPase
VAELQRELANEKARFAKLQQQAKTRIQALEAAAKQHAAAAPTAEVASVEAQLAETAAQLQTTQNAHAALVRVHKDAEARLAAAEAQAAALRATHDDTMQRLDEAEARAQALARDADGRSPAAASAQGRLTLGILTPHAGLLGLL